MKNCIEAYEVGSLDIANILADRRYFTDFGSCQIRASRIQIAVKTRYFVPGLDEHWGQNGAYVAEVSSYENAHWFLPGQLPRNLTAARCRRTAAAENSSWPAKVAPDAR